MTEKEEKEMKNFKTAIEIFQNQLKYMSDQTRFIWPDDKPVPGYPNDPIGRYFYDQLVSARAHMADLYCDLDVLIDTLDEHASEKNG